MVELMKKKVQNKITKSAKGESCTVRIPGECSGQNDQTVFAHKNGAGMAYKSLPIHGCYACHPCHLWLDGGYVRTHTRYERDAEHARAMLETQERLVEKGLLVMVL